jgi:O-succinylbenzoate synthase
MRFDHATIFVFELPLRHNFKTGFGTIDKKMSVVVALRNSDGLVGYGEGATLAFPMYSEEYTAAAALTLRSVLIPRILGKIFESPADVAAELEGVRGNRIAKTAIETAAWDMHARELHQPLYAVLAKSIGVTPSSDNPRIDVGESIGIPAPGEARLDRLLDEVSAQVDAGYKRIKLKVSPDWCETPVAAVRHAYPNLPLMVDGNSSFSLQHAALLKKLDHFNLMMIEQPLGHDDIIDHAQLQRELRTPLCLDESILSAADARKALEIGACRIINIKPGRVGGLTESLKIILTARSFANGNGQSVDIWCGGMLESTIGRFHNLSLAALPDFTLPADMSPSAMHFCADLGSCPLEVRKGRANVPNSLDDFGVNEQTILQQSVEIWDITSHDAVRREIELPTLKHLELSPHRSNLTRDGKTPPLLP